MAAILPIFCTRIMKFDPLHQENYCLFRHIAVFCVATPPSPGRGQTNSEENTIGTS
jgi:hypothetical protein